MKKTVLALLMDVTPLTRAIIGRAFKPTDFEVLWTTSASEAAEASMRYHIDLVLLDLNQPSSTVWKIYTRLTVLNRGTPVVILTEHKAATEEAVADERVAVLKKPFSMVALIQTINTLLGKPSSGAALALNQDADRRDGTTKWNDFSEMLFQRYSAPYDVATPHRSWGINE